MEASPFARGLPPICPGTRTHACSLSPLSTSASRTNPRLLKTSLILTWGRWGLPIPYRVPLLYAVGEPLRLLHVENPTPAQIEAAHAEFCRALSDLFDRYKFYYGWGHKTLRIV